MDETTPQTNTLSNHWSAVATSVCGVSHKRLGRVCQDAYRVQTEGRLLVIAVADGAGSAPMGEIGAEILSRIAVKNLFTLLQYRKRVGGVGWNTVFTNAMFQSLRELQREAESRNVDIREMASTLILAAATDEVVAVAQVGDGAAVASSAGEPLFALTLPQQGEYANETTFLTSKEAIETKQFTFKRQPVTHLALFSDGLQRIGLGFPAGTPRPGFFKPLFEFVSKMENPNKAQKELSDFLESVEVAKRTDDDLTLVLAAWNP